MARVARDHCQSHLKASENLARAASERCESHLRASKNLPERRPNITKMLSEQRFAAALARPRAMACKMGNLYMGGRARQHLAARARRTKTIAFLNMESGLYSHRRGFVTVGTLFSQKTCPRAAEQRQIWQTFLGRRSERTRCHGFGCLL